MSGAAEEAPPSLGDSIAPEDQGRAEFYALLARLWYAPPDRALLEAIAASDDIVAEGEQVALADAWRQLRAAAMAMDPEAARDEYDTLFVGTGKAPVTLYLSNYLVETAKERVLVALRDELAELGLARTGPTHEPEDHLAAVCDAMRHLVASGADDAALQRQRKFFTLYIARGYNPLVDQIMAAASANFYQHVARFTRAFFSIEVTSLEMF